MKYCDLHCDLLYKLTTFQSWFSAENQIEYHVSPEGLFGGVFLQNFAVFSPNEGANLAYFEEKTLLFKRLQAFLSPRGVKCFLSVENGAFLQGKVENVERFARAGVKMITLTWNGGNAISGSHTQRQGLTPFGREVVEEMFRLQITPDVSHLSDAGFFQLAKMAKKRKKALVASHSNARALSYHTRNLTNAQIRAIADSGGVVGINFYPLFLGKFPPAAHIAHAVKIGGEDCVCIGSDFDGIPKGYYKNCMQAYRFLADDLKKEGLSTRIIEKVLQKNALRLLDG